MSRSSVTLAAAACVLLLAACARVPLPPTDLLEVIDLGGATPPRGPEAGRRFLAEGDAAWERRAEPGQAAAARLAYWKAAAAYTSLYDAYWKAARATELIGLAGEDKEGRIAEFERGAGIAQLGIALAPDRAEAHYHYANNLGLLARERRSIGLDSVKQMLPHLERAAEIDPDLDGAGPFRTMALLYLRAPGWPTSVGDEEAGLEFARQAVERAPSHPGNHLALAEALLANGDLDAARAALDRGVELLRADAAATPEHDRMMEEARKLRDKLPAGR